MAKAVRGRLIRRVKVRDFKETLAIPAANKSLFRDGHDTPVVVQTGRHERRVDLAVSSGGEFVIPSWLRKSVEAAASPDDEVAIYLSARSIWLVPGEQDDAITTVSGATVSAQDARAARRLAAVRELSGSLTGMYGPGYLQDLRDEWPS
jgi:hypothetical protein